MIDAATEENVLRGVAEPRQRFARLSRDPTRAIKQLASRVRFLIQYYSEDGQSLRIGQIKHALHAERYKITFDDALSLLESGKQIVVLRVQGRRGRPAIVVTLKQNRNMRLPCPYTYHRPKKRKWKKSQWFIENRYLMDRGKHSGFAQILPWQESAYWLEKEKARDEEISLDEAEPEVEAEAEADYNPD
jgi:hypothetical protein